ncbi:hypothetical protein Aph01nite_67920 [Acrocarpospora phusangensis]|uniref:Uncharacterized protein n=1 Tax=Acrocarpospora phusangensis TaxID=1070424 RepID=A0A919QLQ6_9ACTN|nr:hypothetical protein [Acrocarpospora phusangensis]GIH28482.1 hypothetical protein Aph01nite_67920 [Acrocarpospora phusangensis]
MSLTPHPDPGAILAENERRALEREGIPMFLALEDLRGPIPPVADRAEGPALAELTGTYAAAVRPEAEDGDLAALASVVTVLARVHFFPENGTA